MKASDGFTAAIKTYLKSRAESDSLFAETFKKPNKNINDCVNYILNTVKNSGCNGLHDEEVFNMAVHYYDEDDIKPGAKIDCKVVMTNSVGALDKVIASRSNDKTETKKVLKKQSIVLNQPFLF